MNVLTLRELLALRGLDLNQRIKIVRHSHAPQSIAELRSFGLFEAYQAIQSGPVFECELIVSFEAMERGQARLIGIYKVGDRRPALTADIPDGLSGVSVTDGDCFYELQRLDAFDFLSDRVVIDWGAGTLAWHQWLCDGKEGEGKNKPVVGLQNPGFVREFPGYADLLLGYADLLRLVRNPADNPEWHQKLKAVSGIYLIQHRSSGQLYVGSACGSEGIWGRWCDYALTRHGGNRGLIELLEREPLAFQDFQFALLRTLPGNLGRDEVLRYEALEKLKLGTRVHGLTRN